MEFLSVTDFYSKIEPFGSQINNDSPHIKNVIDAFLNINKGCGCQRNTRVGYANQTYISLFPLLTENEKLLLKTFYNQEVIIFKDGDNLLGQF